MRMKLLMLMLLLSACDSTPMTPEQVEERKRGMAAIAAGMHHAAESVSETAPTYTPPVTCQYYQWGNMVSC